MGFVGQTLTGMGNPMAVSVPTKVKSFKRIFILWGKSVLPVVLFPTLKQMFYWSVDKEGACDMVWYFLEFLKLTNEIQIKHR